MDNPLLNLPPLGAMGYTHHRRIHFIHFFEVADQPVGVTMVVTEEADRLFALLLKEKIHLFYAKLAVEFSTLDAPAAKTP